MSGFGKLGRGPYEYINPYYLKVDKFEKIIMFVETPKSLIVGYRLEDVLQKKESIPIFSSKINPKLMPVSSYAMFNDSSLLLSTTIDSSLYTIVNINGSIIKKIGSRNQKSIKMNPYTYNSFYTNYFVYNEITNTVVTGYEKFDLIEKLNLNNGAYQKIIGNNFKIVKPEIAESGDILNNYAALYNLKCDHKYVYAPFLGEPYFNEIDFTTKHGSEILVFNWDMHPIAKLKFQFQIIDFEIDDNLIYIISDHAENPVLVFKNPLND